MERLATIFNEENAKRKRDKAPQVSMYQFCHNKSTVEFIETLARYLNKQPSDLLCTVGRGKSAMVMADPRVATYAKMCISKEYFAQIVDEYNQCQ
jgi:hypothetical protein